MGGSKDGRTKWIMELERTNIEGNKVGFTYYKLRLWFLDTSLQVSITSYIRGGKEGGKGLGKSLLE